MAVHFTGQLIPLHPTNKQQKTETALEALAQLNTTHED